MQITFNFLKRLSLAGCGWQYELWVRSQLPHLPYVELSVTCLGLCPPVSPAPELPRGLSERLWELRLGRTQLLGEAASGNMQWRSFQFPESSRKSLLLPQGPQTDPDPGRAQRHLRVLPQQVQVAFMTAFGRTSMRTWVTHRGGRPCWQSPLLFWGPGPAPCASDVNSDWLSQWFS